MNGSSDSVIFDARRFTLIRFCKDLHLVSDAQMHKEWLHSVAGWAKRWQNWSGRGTTRLSAFCTNATLPFVHCGEEWGYDAELSDFLDASWAVEVDPFKLSHHFVRSYRPFLPPF